MKNVKNLIFIFVLLIVSIYFPHNNYIINAGDSVIREEIVKFDTTLKKLNMSDSTSTNWVIVPMGENWTWFNNTGTFCASVVNIKEANWSRKFIARSYVMIVYEKDMPEYIYSNVSEARSIKDVTQSV